MVPRTRTDAISVRIPRRRFTTAEYHLMGEAGILAYDERVELLDGDIIEQERIRPPQASCVCRMNALFMRRLWKRATIRVRGPIVLDRYSEPEPDVSILTHRTDFYATGHPRPRDVLLAIEVPNSPRSYDRTLKLPLYARAELREVWLIGVKAKLIEVYRHPALRGYREQPTFTCGQSITPLAFPRMRFRVSEILG